MRPFTVSPGLARSNAVTATLILGTLGGLGGIGSLGTAQAAPLKMVLPNGKDVKAQGTYRCTLSVDQVNVTAKPGQQVSAADLQEYQRRIQQNMLDTFEEYVLDLKFDLSGRSSTTEGKVTLPVKVNFNQENFNMQLDGELTTKSEGWFETQISPLNNLTWKGSGEAPLALLRQHTRQAVNSFMLGTNLVYGYDNAQPLDMVDRLNPGLFCLTQFMEGNLEATTRITWPGAQQYRIETTALEGQEVNLLGVNATVLSGTLVNQGQYALSWPGNFKASSTLKLQLDYPTENLPVNARLTATFSSATTGTWSKP